MNQKTQEFIEKAKEVHADYNYDYSQAIYVNKRTKVKIYCPKHDNWFTPLPGVHINQKTRCKMCGKESGDSKQTLTKEEFINRSNILHNNQYDYSKVDYNNSYTKVNVICKDHGLFSVRPKDHLKSGVYHNGSLLCSGCPKCGDVKGGISRTKSTEYFLDKAEKSHSDKFDYSKVDYKHIHKNIKLTCKKHDLEFEVTPGNFTSNIYNCPECFKEINSELLYTKEEFIEQCKLAHNNLYDYSEIEYSGVGKLVNNIRCVKHGLFNQIGYSHKRGYGCPHCCSSKGELAVKSYLEQNNINFIQQKSFPGCVHKSLLKFDFYLPDHNVAIEFQGRQHFEEISYFGGEESFKEIVLKDEIKSTYCKTNYIELICLSDISEIESELSKFTDEILV